MKQTEGRNNPKNSAQGVGNFKRRKSGKFGRPLTKTVELIVDERSWEPKARPLRAASIVGLRVSINEVGLQQRVKRAGGKWNPAQKLWEIRYERALELGLESRIKSRAI